mmetsp:Transcript_49170/g.72097  ORF Transcript_49170/g.72097 Transcript_49170/m.72097 type:complete len:201 (+) Transcript_49170:261-863(+)
MASSPHASPDDALIQQVVQNLENRGVKAVVFDFDCTITLKHSGGRVRNEKMASFLEGNVSPCFLKLLPALLARSFIVGVATFADSYRAPATHCAGEALVRAHFQHFFGTGFEEQIPIVAAYPDNYQSESAFRSLGLKAPMAQSKEYHLHLLCHLWGLSPAQVALVDDDQKNVMAAANDGHAAMFVPERNGVRIQDMEPLN